VKHWSERDRDVLWHPFTQQREWDPLVIQRGEGNYLFDVDGTRYLDGVSSLWCNLHGHNHPRLNSAIESQLRTLAHSTFLGLSHPPGIILAERLLALFEPRSLSRVFYSDSGSAAVEIALKLAFQYCQLTGQTERKQFLHLSQSYHGDTLGAVGVGGIEIFHRVYGPLVVPGIPVNTPFLPATEGLTEKERLARGLLAVDRVLDQHGHAAAAFVIEPLIQGAAGMLTHPRGYLKGVAERCAAHGVLLIVDEVATGFGRTGTVFACEHEQVVPDFLCLAKGISGGYLPLAATLTTETIYDAFLGERREMKHFFHGHTYTANPLACAAGIASLDLVLENRDRIAVLPSRLQSALDRLDSTHILEIRGVGSMIGIELGPFPTDRFVGAQVCHAARSHGLILRPLGDVLVWMPPLSITDDEIDLLASATAAAIADVLD
jgi:adenosylmethionine---8-amino-7-oxononanoate aminotransferase